MWDYDTFSEVQRQLLVRSTIDLAGEVDGRMIDYVREALIRLKAADSPDIEVIITSRGGDGVIAFNIYDLLIEYSGLVTGKVMGYAKSAGMIILQACNERLAQPHSTLMIHNPQPHNQISWSVLHDETQLNKLRGELNLVRNRVLDILQKSTGCSREQLEKIMDEGKDLTPTEALKFGLIDSIIMPAEKTRSEQ